MTYVSPLHNQDGVSRNLALSEQENNRVHKELTDQVKAQESAREEDELKDQNVNELKEQDELNPDDQANQEKKDKSQSKKKGATQENHGPAAHLGGGDFLDFNA